MNRRLLSVAIVACGLLGLVCSGDQDSTTQATVARVVDGDTIELGNGDAVRIIGIDTPEEDECGYQEATDHLADLILDREVMLTPSARGNSDRYGRLLRYVDLGDLDAGLAQIEAGFAHARYDSRDGYGSHPREDLYHRTEDAAPLPVCVPGIATSDIPGVVSGGYPFCAAAIADGAAPLREDDLGWNPALDRDQDGVACE